MRKGIKVTGIIWGILCILGVILCAIMCGIFVMGLASADVIAKMASENKVTVEEMQAVLYVYTAIWSVLACECLAGSILSFVMVGKRESNMSKGKGITLGVFGIIFGATLPGIFFIIDSAKTRQ